MGTIILVFYWTSCTIGEIKTMPFNQSKYANDFAKQNYDRLNIQVPKGQKAVIEEHWRNRGYKSLNAYVNELIKKDMESN